MDIRRKLALWICPELAPRQVGISSEVLDSTRKNICTLIDLLAAGISRSPSTISRLSTGSGDTVNRLRLFKEDGQPKHRISTDRAAAAILWLSDNWPTDLAWSRHIPRPKPSNKEAT